MRHFFGLLLLFGSNGMSQELVPKKDVAQSIIKDFQADLKDAIPDFSITPGKSDCSDIINIHNWHVERVGDRIRLLFEVSPKTLNRRITACSMFVNNDASVYGLVSVTNNQGSLERSLIDSQIELSEEGRDLEQVEATLFVTLNDGAFCFISKTFPLNQTNNSNLINDLPQPSSNCEQILGEVELSRINFGTPHLRDTLELRIERASVNQLPSDRWQFFLIGPQNPVPTPYLYLKWEGRFTDGHLDFQTWNQESCSSLRLKQMTLFALANPYAQCTELLTISSE